MSSSISRWACSGGAPLQAAGPRLGAVAAVAGHDPVGAGAEVGPARRAATTARSDVVDGGRLERVDHARAPRRGVSEFLPTGRSSTMRSTPPAASIAHRRAIGDSLTGRPPADESLMASAWRVDGAEGLLEHPGPLEQVVRAACPT